MFTLRDIAFFAAFSTLAGCSAAVTDGSGSGQGVEVTVQPPTAEVLPAGTIQFAAAVTGTAVGAVTWTVDEGAGGSVSATGLYTAPSAVGTYHVRASSQADAKATATATVTVTPTPVVAVTITPRTATVAAGGTLSFGATVTGSANTAVTWSVREGASCGSVTSAGAYAAPALGATCHVVATSVADPSRSDTATVTVTPPPVRVALSPSSGTVDACLTLTFRATVTGSADTAVTWSVQEGAAGGTVSTSGVYTAPANAGTYHVVAASHAAPSSTATATVTVQDHVLSVTVSPAQVSVTEGGTAQFSATVTTTCGAFTSVQNVATN